jgi:hypothetical protein
VKEDPAKPIGPRLIWVVCATCAAWLSSCSSIPSVDERMILARTMAVTAGFTEREITTPQFALRAFARSRSASPSTVRVFIEGDGFAFINRTTPSLNPTPTDPLALSLAAIDTSDAVVYLARPCQYQDADAPCNNRYWWTRGRLSDPVVASMSTAIDVLKRDLGAEQIELVGYSGGGALAVLLAAQRSDIRLLVTVAGLIDSARWLSHHKLSPMDIAENPAALIDRVSEIPQWHFIGADDQVIPPEIALLWASAAAIYPAIHVAEVPNTTHYCCWAELWRGTDF